MSSFSNDARGERHSLYDMREKWAGFLMLGVALVLSGVAAVTLPAVSTFAASAVLGGALMGAGVIKMLQSLTVKEWSGFIWQEMTGAVELVGGFMIYSNPLKGVATITLLISLVFLVHGLLQIALAFRVGRREGGAWLLMAGIVALGASAVLTLKLPYTRTYTPGTAAGISLLVAGGAYIAIGLTTRKAKYHQ